MGLPGKDDPPPRTGSSDRLGRKIRTSVETRETQGKISETRSVLGGPKDRGRADEIRWAFRPAHGGPL